MGRQIHELRQLLGQAGLAHNQLTSWVLAHQHSYVINAEDAPMLTSPALQIDHN